MEAQIGGLNQAGFAITGFYEDRRPEGDGQSHSALYAQLLCVTSGEKITMTSTIQEPAPKPTCSLHL